MLFRFLKMTLKNCTRWVRNTIKRFNLYERYVVDHWKNPWAQQGHIRRQLKTRDDPEVVYFESKIVDVVRVQFDQGYVPEYMSEIVVKRANGDYTEFSESDYKYLHNNDIKDIIEKEKLLSITSETVVGLIYENNKQEKRAVIIKEIPKFCDATLKRVLEKVKKFHLDVKHGYADPELRN
ncbi:hypothetical protein Tco_1182880 [Tanacetum coccineum]